MGRRYRTNRRKREVAYLSDHANSAKGAIKKGQWTRLGPKITEKKEKKNNKKFSGQRGEWEGEGVE